MVHCVGVSLSQLLGILIFAKARDQFEEALPRSALDNVREAVFDHFEHDVNRDGSAR